MLFACPSIEWRLEVFVEEGVEVLLAQPDELSNLHESDTPLAHETPHHPRRHPEAFRCRVDRERRPIDPDAGQGVGAAWSSADRLCRLGSASACPGCGHGCGQGESREAKGCVELRWGEWS